MDNNVNSLTTPNPIQDVNPLDINEFLAKTPCTFPACESDLGSDV